MKQGGVLPPLILLYGNPYFMRFRKDDFGGVLFNCLTPPPQTESIVKTINAIETT